MKKIFSPLKKNVHINKEKCRCFLRGTLLLVATIFWTSLTLLKNNNVIIMGVEDSKSAPIEVVSAENLPEDGLLVLYAKWTPVDNGGISGGAIAGIVIGSVVLLGAAGFCVYWFIIKKRKSV